MKRLIFGTFIWLLVLTGRAYPQNITINGARKYQVIQGLGVNANPQSWNLNPGAVKKVIDSLVTGMGCTSFRLMFDDCDWETVNDNDDPESYNWKYYDSLYSTARFTGIWEMIRYLNKKGVTDITLSPDGAAPAWMGGTKLMAGKEAEYAEMMASMVNYGRKRLKPALQFNMLSPLNETTCGGGEGTVLNPAQFALMFREIASHLIKDGLSNFTLIGPDDCDGWLDNFQALVKDKVIMSKLKFFGQHEYGNTFQKATDMIRVISQSAYPDRGAIMTEVNAVCKDCDGGVYNSDYGFNAYSGPAYKYVLQHLNAGMNGIQLWEAYDSRYHHPNRYLTWSMWGIFAVNDTTRPEVYTRRSHYDVFKQLYKFVKPGFKRIDISTNLPDMTVSAFYNESNGGLVITGKNDHEEAQSLDGLLKSVPAISELDYYYTDDLHHFQRGTPVKVKAGRFVKSIPAFAVFTLVSKP